MREGSKSIFYYVFSNTEKANRRSRRRHRRGDLNSFKINIFTTFFAFRVIVRDSGNTDSTTLTLLNARLLIFCSINMFYTSFVDCDVDDMDAGSHLSGRKHILT